MIEDGLFALIDPVMKDLGAIPDAGEDYREPPLDILRYYVRGVRLHWVPFFGWGLSVVAVLRQPIDLAFTPDASRTLLSRLGAAVDARFPPLGPGRHPKGLALGITAVVLTPEPIGPGDDDVMTKGHRTAWPALATAGGAARTAADQSRSGSSLLRAGLRARRCVPGADRGWLVRRHVSFSAYFVSLIEGVIAGLASVRSMSFR